MLILSALLGKKKILEVYTQKKICNILLNMCYVRQKMHNEHIWFLRNDTSPVSAVCTEFMNILFFILCFLLDQPVHISGLPDRCLN